MENQEIEKEPVSQESAEPEQETPETQQSPEEPKEPETEAEQTPEDGGAAQGKKSRKKGKGESGGKEAEALREELEQVRAQLAAAQDEKKAQDDRYLRLAAEYDNFRKRSQKEKEATWANAKADTVAALLPVYDNLERALKQETSDSAYKKGVEMTMNQLNEVFKKLGVETIDAQGQPFDPVYHNAVMHEEDENLGENTVAEVFQTGFKLGDRVIRCAMVKVAN